MFDNVKGFENQILVAEALHVDTYFNRPYTSQDNGTVENRIGQLGRFLSKMTELSNVIDLKSSVMKIHKITHQEENLITIP